MHGLDGETAVITGASSGIGEGLARMLARLGATVALAARRERQLQRVADEIRAAGGAALVVPTDVGRDADLRGLLGRVDRELGPIDVLVNAAGVAAYQPIHELDMPLWDLHATGGQPASARGALRRGPAGDARAPARLHRQHRQRSRGVRLLR